VASSLYIVDAYRERYRLPSPAVVRGPS